MAFKQYCGISGWLMNSPTGTLVWQNRNTICPACSWKRRRSKKDWNLLVMAISKSTQYCLLLRIFNSGQRKCSVGHSEHGACGFMILTHPQPFGSSTCRHIHRQLQSHVLSPDPPVSVVLTPRRRKNIERWENRWKALCWPMLESWFCVSGKV